MPTKLVKTFKSWSYSRLTAWEECPFRAKLKHLDKVPEPEGPALARGRAIEDELYAYLFDKKVKRLPASGERFAEELAALRKIAKYVLNNRDLAFDRDWKPCRWDDWGRAWLRVRMDLLWASDPDDPFKLPKRFAAYRVVDLKTGKVYEDKVDQLDLYKLTAHLVEPGLLPASDVALSQLWYLDQGETRPDGSWSSLLGPGVTRAKAYWERRVRPMLLDEAFVPRPSVKCKWCPHAKNKGGICPY